MALIKREDIPAYLDEYHTVFLISNILSHKWQVCLILTLQQPIRFNELRRKLNISHSVLSNELKDLELLLLVKRHAMEKNNQRFVEYSLTEEGEKLFGILMKLNEFGEDYEKKLIANTGRLNAAELIDKKRQMRNSEEAI